MRLGIGWILIEIWANIVLIVYPVIGCLSMSLAIMIIVIPMNVLSPPTLSLSHKRNWKRFTEMHLRSILPEPHPVGSVKTENKALFRGI